MIRNILAVVLTLILGGICCGCSIEESAGTKVSEVEYTIVQESEIPEELKVMIEEKKASDFKLTYDVENDRYIVRGYGEQATGGYSISIKNLYLTSNAVLFDTELIGPRKGETTSQSPSYPYIIVKIAVSEEPVIFE